MSPAKLVNWIQTSTLIEYFSKNCAHINMLCRVPFSIIAAVLVSVSLGCSDTTLNSDIDMLAQAKFKQQAYVMDFEGTPIGTLITTGRIIDEKQFEFIQEFSFTSMRNTTLRAKQVLRFSLDSPHLLEDASFQKFSSKDNAAYETVRLERGEFGLTVQGKEIPFKNLPTDYSLQDFLGLERWLSREDLTTGTRLSLVTINFEQRESTSVIWTVKQVSSKAVLIRSEQGIDSEFDRAHPIPQLKTSRHPSGLTLRHVDNLPEWNSPSVAELSRRATSVPLVGSLPRPKDLSLLELTISFAHGEPGPWSELLTAADTLLIDHSLNRSTSGAKYFLHGNSIENIATSDDIRDLTKSLTDGLASDEEKLAAIVKFTHDYVRYAKSDAPQSVAHTLRTKSGDCSDIAELFRVLATAAGLQSRTVYGLAYDGATNSFGIHAWNQVRLEDNQLRSVDPTWNQLRADATHIEFPEAYAHEVLASLEHMQLSVVRFKHFDSRS